MAFLKRNILIVDSQPTARKALEAILRQSGYVCSIANDSFDAVDMIQKYPFDLILTEIHLQHSVGMDALNRLKSAPRAKGIPIIVTSERSDKLFIEKCITFGASDYVLKPIVSQSLLQKLERILGGRPRFAEVPMVADDTGYSEVVFSSHVVSIGEAGMSMWSPIPLDTDTVHRIRAKVFAQIGIHSPDLKVVHCEPQDSGFLVYFTFLGLKQKDIQNVRTWVIEKNLSPSRTI